MSAIKDRLKKNIALYKFVRKCKWIKTYINSYYVEALKFYVKYYLKKAGILPKDKFIASLKDKYKGENIFIIATGPSLSISDIELIKDSGVVTISMNGIFKSFNETDWRPDYYILDDYWLLEVYRDQYPELEMDKISAKGSLYAEKSKRFLPNWKKMINTGFFNICYFDHWLTHYSNKFKYTSKFDLGIFDFYSVTNSAVALAEYMGAKNIFLIGVDCNYSLPAAHYGEESKIMTDEKIKQSNEVNDSVSSGFHMLNILKGNNINIYNCTRGGMLGEFPRMELETALK